MNLSLQKTWPAVAATVALSTLVMATPQAAHALSFSIAPPGTTSQTNWVGLPTTVIDFSSSSGNVPSNNPTTNIATSPTNGNATIQRTDGSAIFTSNNPLFTGGGQYLSVGASSPGNPNNNGSGAVNFAFSAAKGLGYFGLYWASPSVTDVITFTLRSATGSGVTTQAFTGKDIFGSSTTGGFVNFFATSPDPRVITSVLLSDSSDIGAFQVDNIAYQAIPTPALLPGLLAMGAGMLRKRKAQAGVEVEADA